MDHLQTEGRNPASMNLDELTSLQLVQLMNDEDRLVVSAVATQAEAIARAIEVIADRLRRGGRLVYCGAGTSGRLGILDATECPPTFNSPPSLVVGLIAGGPPAVTAAVEGAEDHPEYGERDLESIQFSGRDVLVGIATSGRTPYVLGAVAKARQLGAFTIGISCNTDSALSTAVELPIAPIVGPEILSGSTRLKSGTATKLVLNMLSTGAMVRLGKTYGNLMVDLRATNVKLRARANRIVRILTGANTDEADALLKQCNGDLKAALIVRLAGVTVEEAGRRLAASGGQVRQALASPERQTSTGAGPAEDLILGIDGGGTHTVALLARKRGHDWDILGRGEAGPSNIQAVGRTRTFQALDKAILLAFQAAEEERRPAAAACFGMAGAGRAEDQAVICRWAEGNRIAGRIEVSTDAALLLAAGTPTGWGVAVVAGTGSIAVGRTPAGELVRSGGWGYLLGDEGSGYAVVMRALRAVTEAADGRREPTALTDLVLRNLHLENPTALVPMIYRGGLDRAEWASLAPLVFEAAQQGDETARGVIRQEAQELARTVAAVIRKLGPVDPPPLALAGGLLQANAAYRELLLAEVATLGASHGPVHIVTEPAEGALRLARMQEKGV